MRCEKQRGHLGRAHLNRCQIAAGLFRRQQFTDLFPDIVAQSRGVANMDVGNFALLVDDDQRRESLHAEFLR